MEQKHILRVVVASPGDVQPEREMLDAVVAEVNRHVAHDRGLMLNITRWETDAYAGFHADGPQGLIDAILRIPECDVFIGIFWKRFGTPTLDAPSGTAHEFQLAYEAWKEKGSPQVLFFFKQTPYMPRTEEEAIQQAQVLRFQKNFPREGLWWPFKSKAKFPELVRNQLSNLIRHQFPTTARPRAVEPAPASPDTAREAPGRGANELAADYRAWLAERVGRVYVFGEPEARPLDRVFVELSIIEEAGRPSSHAEFLGLMDAEMRRRRDPFARDEEGDGSRGGGKPARTVGPEELLRGRAQAVIAGAPGCGKTTLLKYLTLKTLEAGERLPVFVECKAITAESFRESGRDLSELLFERGVAVMPGVAESERARLRELFMARLGAGEAAVFLDGLDEVSGADFFPRLRESVGEFLRSALGNNTLVISTRPYALQARFEGMKQMEIAPLGPRQVEEFFAHYYGDDAGVERLLQALRQRRPLRELMRVPFLLAVIARLYREHDRIVESRLELYRQIVLQLAVQLDREKSVVRTEFRVPDRSGALKLDFLRRLAFERLLLDEVEAEGERLVFTGEDILAKAKQFWAGGPPSAWSPYELAEDVKATPLLREVGADAYAFSHLTVQEYLAATALARRPDREKIFCGAYFNPTLAEMEVLPMTLGLVPRPERLFDALEHLPESLTYTSLRLRARALAYATDLARPALLTLARHLDRFINEERTVEQSYLSPVLQSFSAAGGRALEFLLEHVASILSGGSVIAQQRAAWALRRFGDKRSLAPLLEALKDANSVVRRAALSALSSIGGERVLPHLLHAATSGDDYLRSEAANALGRFKGEGVTATLLRLLLDKRAGLEALWALQKLNCQAAAVSSIISILRGGNKEVISEALGWQRFIVDERLVEPILALLGHADWVVRYKAAGALGDQGDERAVEPLIRALDDGSLLVRWFALESLGKIGGERATAALNSALNSNDGRMSNIAAASLAKLGDERATGILLDIVRDHARVDWHAVSAFIVIKDARALGPLKELLRHGDRSVRQKAAAALEHLGDASAVPQLILATGDSDGDVRAAAVVALGKFGGSASVPALLASLGDDDYFTRKGAAQALGKLEDEALAEGLEWALGDGREFVRRRAAEVVGYYVEAGRVRGELARMAEGDPVKEVRAAAAEALAAVERKAACFG